MDGVLQLAALLELFAMIGEDDEDRRVANPARGEPVEQSPELSVPGCDLRVVERPEVGELRVG